MKNEVWKKKNVHDYFEHVNDLLKHHQFASNFEHWNFASIGAYSKKHFDNQIYYAPFVIFQRYKIRILNTIHTPYGSF